MMGVFATICGTCMSYIFTLAPLFTTWTLYWACKGYKIHYRSMKDMNEYNQTQCIDECLDVIR